MWGNEGNVEIVCSAKVFTNLLPYAVTMAMHFSPLSKDMSRISTPEGQQACQIWLYKFGSRSIRKVSPIFSHNMWLPWQRTFRNLEKCVLHISTSTPTYVPNFIWNALFLTILGRICCYHGNTLSTTVKKCVLHIYTPIQTSVLSFMKIVQKLRK